MTFPRSVVCLALFCAGCVTADLPDRKPVRGYGLSKGLEQKLDLGRPLSRDEVVQLSRRGMSADEIVGYLRRGGGVYRLSENDRGALLEKGVDPAVVDYLFSTVSIPKLKYGRASTPAARASSISGSQLYQRGEEVPSSGLEPNQVVTQRPEVVGQGVVTGQ